MYVYTNICGVYILLHEVQAIPPYTMYVLYVRRDIYLYLYYVVYIRSSNTLLMTNGRWMSWRPWESSPSFAHSVKKGPRARFKPAIVNRPLPLLFFTSLASCQSGVEKTPARTGARSPHFFGKKRFFFSRALILSIRVYIYMYVCVDEYIFSCTPAKLF